METVHGFQENPDLVLRVSKKLKELENRWRLPISVQQKI
jgi:hypothetical protein